MNSSSLNGRTFRGAVLSAQRARPTREAMAQWWEAQAEIQRARIEADRLRLEAELAQRLTADPASVSTTKSTSSAGCSNDSGYR